MTHEVTTLPVSGYTLVQEVLNNPRGGLKELLRLADGEETHWLEGKATLHPPPEGFKRNERHSGRPEVENIDNFRWNLAKAVIALANTCGGAVILGVADHTWNAVGLEASDPDQLIRDNNLDKFKLKIVDPALTGNGQGVWQPLNDSGKQTKYTCEVSSLQGRCDFKKVSFQGKTVLAILVRPVALDQDLIPVYQHIENLKATSWPTRSIGKAKNCTLDLNQLKEWQKVRPSLFDRFPTLLKTFQTRLARDDVDPGAKNQIDDLLQDYRSREFHGREDILRTIDEFIKDPSGGALLVSGPSGIGKTALMVKVIDTYTALEPFVYLFSYKKADTPAVARYYRRLTHYLRGVRKDIDDSSEPEELLRSINSLERLRSEITHLCKLISTRNVGTPGASHPPVLLIMDGLDEAEIPYFDPPFKKSELHGIHVIASARAGENDDVLTQWTSLLDSSHQRAIRLGSLSAQDVTSWLRCTRHTKLQPLADDNEFVDAVLRKSQGSPLYIECLFDAFARADDITSHWPSLLQAYPEGYANYVRQDFEDTLKTTVPLDYDAQLEAIEAGRQLVNLTALLVTAKGPLSQSELIELDRRNTRTDCKFPPDIQSRNPRQERWLSKSNYGGELSLSLQNELTREALEGLPRLAAPIRAFEDLLQTYCDEWINHKQLYAIRHLPVHLRDKSEKKWHHLATLLTNQDFLDLRRKMDPDDPMASLHLVQTSLAEATRNGDIEGICEMMLTHAEVYKLITNPAAPHLEALSRVDRAKYLATVTAGRDIAMSTLWRMLAILHCHQSASANAVEDLFADILDANQLIMLNGIHATLAAEVLFRLMSPHDARFPRLAQLLLDDESKYLIVRRIAPVSSSSGMTIAEDIRDVTLRRKALAEVLSNMVIAGRSDQASSYTQSVLNDKSGCLASACTHEYILLMLEVIRCYSTSPLCRPALMMQMCDSIREQIDEHNICGSRKALHDCKARMRKLREWKSYHAQALVYWGLVLNRESTQQARQAFHSADNIARYNNTNPNGFNTYVCLAEHWPFGDNGKSRRFRQAIEAFCAYKDNPDFSPGVILSHYLELLKHALSPKDHLHFQPQDIDQILRGYQAFRKDRDPYLCQEDRDKLDCRFVERLCISLQPDWATVTRSIQNIKDKAIRSRAVFIATRRAMTIDSSGRLFCEALESQLRAAPLALGISRAIMMMTSGADGLNKATMTLDQAVSDALCRINSHNHNSAQHSNLTDAFAYIGAAEKGDNVELCLNAALVEACREELPSLRSAMHLCTVAACAKAAKYGTKSTVPLAIALRKIKGAKRERPQSMVEAYCALASAEVAEPDPSRRNMQISMALQAARKQAETLKGPEYVLALAEIAESYSSLQQHRYAWEVIALIEGEVKKIRGKRDAERCLVTLISGLVKAGTVAEHPNDMIDYFKHARDLYRDAARPSECAGSQFFALSEYDEAKRAMAVVYSSWIGGCSSWNEATGVAEDFINQIADPSDRARALRDVAIARARRRDSLNTFGAIRTIAVGRDRGDVLHKVALIFSEQREKTGFLQLVPLCSWSYGEMYLMLGYLATLWPESASIVANVLIAHNLLDRNTKLKWRRLSADTPP